MEKLAWDVRPAPPIGGAVVASVRGDLDHHGRAAFVAALSDLLVGHRGVVLDVSGLHPHHSDAVHAFLEAFGGAGGWPRACLALVAPGPALAALLTASGVAREVPVYAEVAEALAHLADRPDIVRDGRRFDVDPHAPGRARTYVR